VSKTITLLKKERKEPNGILFNSFKALEAVRAFNPYDLYSKSDEPVDVSKLRPYYENLLSQYFPPQVEW